MGRYMTHMREASTHLPCDVYVCQEGAWCGYSIAHSSGPSHCVKVAALLALLGDTAWGVQWVKVRGERCNARLWRRTQRIYRALPPWPRIEETHRIMGTPFGTALAIARLARGQPPFGIVSEIGWGVWRRQIVSPSTVMGIARQLVGVDGHTTLPLW